MNTISQPDKCKDLVGTGVLRSGWVCLAQGLLMVVIEGHRLTQEIEQPKDLR